MKKHKGQYYGGFTKMDIKLINKQVLEDKLYLLSLGAILSFWLPHIKYPRLNIKDGLFVNFAIWLLLQNLPNLFYSFCLKFFFACDYIIFLKRADYVSIALMLNFVCSDVNSFDWIVLYIIYLEHALMTLFIR